MLHVWLLSGALGAGLINIVSVALMTALQVPAVSTPSILLDFLDKAESFQTSLGHFEVSAVTVLLKSALSLFRMHLWYAFCPSWWPCRLFFLKFHWEAFCTLCLSSWTTIKSFLLICSVAAVNRPTLEQWFICKVRFHFTAHWYLVFSTATKKFLANL